MFQSSLLLPTVRVGIYINNRSKLPWNVGTYVSIYTASYSRRFGYLSAQLWETQMLHTCKYPHVHAYTFRDTTTSTTVLSPDITHHLLREAVNIPVIVSLPGPWSTTRMQINNLFLLAGHRVWVFYPCNHGTGQVHIYQVLHIIKQYLHWPRFLQVIFWCSCDRESW